VTDIYNKLFLISFDGDLSVTGVLNVTRPQSHYERGREGRKFLPMPRIKHRSKHSFIGTG
jgi:hypothetical protein